MLLLILSILLIGLYLLWREYQSHIRRFQECADKIPGPKPLPIVGNALEFGLSNKSFFEYCLKQLPKKYGPVIRIWIGPKFTVGLADPVLIEFVLNSSKAQQKSRFYKLAEAVMGPGLLVNGGEIWKRHRKIIAPTFKGQILEDFLDIFNSNTDTLISQILQYQNGPDFDIAPLMSLYALDIVCETAMGVKVNAMLHSESEYVKALNSALELVYTRIYKPWLHSDIIFNLTSYGRRWAKWLRIVHGTVQEVIEKRKHTIAAEQDEKTGYRKRTAFLDYLLQYVQKGGQFSDQEIQDEVHNIMIAGHETTAVCLGYTCWLLAKHPDVQEKAIAELRTIFGESMRHTTLQDVNEMRYMDQILKESMRLLPPIPLIGRQATEDVDTGKYIFPAGCEIAINIYMLHRHPDYFPDPEKFDPDRFLPENCAERHPYSYLPFGGGPRACLGYKYAFYEMKVAMAQILRHFKILPADDSFQDLDLTIKVSLRSLNGVRIRLESR